jgi:predicted dehydrogenase
MICKFATNINDYNLFKKIKIGIAGEINACQKYIDNIAKQSAYEIVGTFDTSNPNNFNNFYGIYPFTDFINRLDAVVFCGNEHIGIQGLIVEAVRSSKHIMVEKFPDLDYNAWSVIQKLSKEADVIFSISNILGNSCQFIAAKNLVHRPTFIQSHVHVPFYSKNSEIAIKQMLLENIDMVLRCVNSPIQKVDITKHYIFNSKPASPDEIKFNILFDNKTTAEIVLNSLENQPCNIFKLYQKGKIIKVDINEYTLEETRLFDDASSNLSLFHANESGTIIKQSIQKTEKNIIYFDVIQKDLLNFVDCITNHVTPLVSIEESMDVVSVLQDLTYNYNEIFV